ncbi:unnamed protein product, partial [marine sediment metagenome]
KEKLDPQWTHALPVTMAKPRLTSAVFAMPVLCR